MHTPAVAFPRSSTLSGLQLGEFIHTMLAYLIAPLCPVVEVIHSREGPGRAFRYEQTSWSAYTVVSIG